MSKHPFASIHSKWGGILEQDVYLFMGPDNFGCHLAAQHLGGERWEVSIAQASATFDTPKAATRWLGKQLRLFEEAGLIETMAVKKAREDVLNEAVRRLGALSPDEFEQIGARFMAQFAFNLYDCKKDREMVALWHFYGVLPPRKPGNL